MYNYPVGETYPRPHDVQPGGRLCHSGGATRLRQILLLQTGGQRLDFHTPCLMFSPISGNFNASKQVANGSIFGIFE